MTMLSRRSFLRGALAASVVIPAKLAEAQSFGNNGFINVLEFGSFSATDNGPLFQQAIDFCETNGVGLYSPARGTLPFTTEMTIQTHFFRMTGDGSLGILRWDNPTGNMFTVGLPNPQTGPLIGPEFKDLRFAQGEAPTSGSCFKLNNVAQASFENIRTDNFYRHYDTEGATRPMFNGCRAYGSTLWPSGTFVGGSSILRLGEFAQSGGTFKHAANVFIDNCEWASNDATRQNMQSIIEASSCDGLFIDSTSYIGLSKIANLRCVPARPASQFTNFQIECFNDGGQHSSNSCVEFTEPSVGYMTGACNSIRIGGILSGAAGNGIRQNIAAMTDMKVPATIKACGAYPINWLRGTGLNAKGGDFFNNGINSIGNPTGAALTGP